MVFILFTWHDFCKGLRKFSLRLQFWKENTIFGICDDDSGVYKIYNRPEFRSLNLI